MAIWRSRSAASRSSRLDGGPAEAVTIEGDANVLLEFNGHLEEPERSFSIPAAPRSGPLRRTRLSQTRRARATVLASASDCGAGPVEVKVAVTVVPGR